MNNQTPPQESYGILRQFCASTAIVEASEQLRNLGFAIIDAGYTPDEIQSLSNAFEAARIAYGTKHGLEALRKINEHNTVRAPLIHGGRAFQDLAANQNILDLLRTAISGKFILNQQNGVINPPREGYNQGSWHRDLPYQHFVSSKPLAINAVFCLDDFTRENGATFVLPASHLHEEFPSNQYVMRNAIQVEAKRGSFIVLDCMLYHAGGFNHSSLERRAINHVYTVPYFKQQINLAAIMIDHHISADLTELFGFSLQEPRSIEEYLKSRKGKAY